MNVGPTAVYVIALLIPIEGLVGGQSFTVQADKPKYSFDHCYKTLEGEAIGKTTGNSSDELVDKVAMKISK